MEEKKSALLEAIREQHLANKDDGSLFAAERDWLITTSDIADGEKIRGGE